MGVVRNGTNIGGLTFTICNHVLFLRSYIQRRVHCNCILMCSKMLVGRWCGSSAGNGAELTGCDEAGWLVEPHRGVIGLSCGDGSEQLSGTAGRCGRDNLCTMRRCISGPRTTKSQGGSRQMQMRGQQLLRCA